MAQQSPKLGSLKNYIKIARLDHWGKQVFMVPGVAASLTLDDTSVDPRFWLIFGGFLAASIAASANYVINEWLDAPTDRLHPLKKNRPAAMGLVTKRFVYGEYVLLAALSLLIAATISTLFLAGVVALLVSGILYNVKPFRTKDIPYVDVLTESFNNPLRLLLGWGITSHATVPPLSLFLVFWFGGAFLMTIKRLAEYRCVVETKDVEALHGYRKSFQSYSEASLLIASFMYTALSSFSIAVFLVKYKIELLLTGPLFAALFSYYLHIGLKKQSIAQTPELLFKDKVLVALLLLITLAIGVLLNADIPVMEQLFQSKFTSIHLGR